MPADLWGGVKIPIREINQIYAGLFSRFERTHGMVAAALSIPAELDDLEACTVPMFAQGGINAVIMGHTHDALAHQFDLPLLGRAAYVNSGCWCNRKPRATWVEQVKTVDNHCRRTRLTVMGCSGVDEQGDLTEVRADFPSVIAG
jgi:hypothetical protein